jgi:DnaK suppressor protein
MKKKEIESFRKVLQERRNDVSPRATRAGNLGVELTADAVDEAQSSSLRELAVQLMNANWETQRAIDIALDRIQTGGYGECDDCGEEIGPGRLAALPWATLCIRCQEETENEEEPVLIRGKF